MKKQSRTHLLFAAAVIFIMIPTIVFAGPAPDTGLQIKNKISTLENIKQEIINGNLSETRKAQIKKELYDYIDRAFELINNPSNKKLLIWFQYIIAELLPEENVKIVNEFITIAPLNLSTEEKIELFYATNSSSAYETCYAVFITGYFILVIGTLLLIIGTGMFGGPFFGELFLLAGSMIVIGLGITAIGLICMLLSL